MLKKTVVALGVFGLAALAAAPAGAAVTVIGNGLASACFRAAEFGGNAQDGVAVCTLALEQEPLAVRDRAATLINRGILRSRVEEPQSALADYNQGLQEDPLLAEGYVDRGVVFILMRRYDDALQDIDKGIAMGASRLQIAYYDRAIVQEALGNVRGAYEDYKKATEIAPDFALATAQLARFKVVRSQGDGT